MKFSKIKSIKEVETKPICHMTVKNNGNFFANNLCIHNSNFRGEIGVILINHGYDVFKIEKGQKIAQIVVTKVERAEIEVVEDLSDSERGAGGFGSTGLEAKK